MGFKRSPATDAYRQAVTDLGRLLVTGEITAAEYARQSDGLINEYFDKLTIKISRQEGTP